MGVLRNLAVRFPFVLLFSVACAPATAGVTGSGSAPDRAPTEPVSALDVDSALHTIAATPLWPRFEPLRIPVAIFDGSRTYLFRHPAPPAGYASSGGRPDVAVREGRDPAITANTSAPIGGAATATVMLDGSGSAGDIAALAVHELFHVFQQARHPAWQANEADLFTLPIDHGPALALRREETSALRSALGAGDAAAQRCWARNFVAVRARRFALIGGPAAAYERGSELNEGLARYVERRAAGARPTLAESDPPAADVRRRAYEVGAAIGVLLDSAQPQWREQLDSSSSGVTSLDALLADAVGASRVGSGIPCSAPPHVRARWLEEATAEVDGLVAARSRVLDAYLAQPGRSLLVEAGDPPLFPAGFDPLNVERVSATEILHTRFLKLQGALGTLELLGRAVLTEGATRGHPLFAGVRRVTITGLDSTLTIRDSSGVLAVEARGVSARLPGARADTTGDEVRLRRP